MLYAETPLATRAGDAIAELERMSKSLADPHRRVVYANIANVIEDLEILIMQQQITLNVGVESVIADWFTLNPKYRTKDKLLEMIRKCTARNT